MAWMSSWCADGVQQWILLEQASLQVLRSRDLFLDLPKRVRPYSHIQLQVCPIQRNTGTLSYWDQLWRYAALHRDWYSWSRPKKAGLVSVPRRGSDALLSWLLLEWARMRLLCCQALRNSLRDRPNTTSQFWVLVLGLWRCRCSLPGLGN